VKLYDELDILLGVEALNEAIAAGMPLDKYSTIVKVYQKAGMISPRAVPAASNKKKEQTDGPQPCEALTAPDVNPQGCEAPGPCPA
jgi:hypothetical protein